MNTAERPPIGAEFDRYLREYNDATTWLAETLDGSMRTPFEFEFDGHEDFHAADGGSMRKVFEDSLVRAQRLASERPELSFELRRTRHEWDERSDMVAMARGEAPNTMVVVSDFPAELKHATKDVGGYNVTRQQTMLRVLTWQNGKLKMYSQSLDKSDRTGLEAIYAQFGATPQPGELLGQRIHVNLNEQDQLYLTDRLTGVYDRKLAEKYGGNWYAGRQEKPHDTYAFVLSQSELVDRFVMCSMQQGGVTGEDRYNIAALLTQRFEQFKNPQQVTIDEADIMFGAIMSHNLDLQLRMAGIAARAEGKNFSGCGVSANSGGGRTINDELAEAGYGPRAEDDGDNLGPVWFTCPKGHMNLRPHGQQIPRCHHCGTSVRCKPESKPKAKQGFTFVL